MDKINNLFYLLNILTNTSLSIFRIFLHIYIIHECVNFRVIHMKEKLRICLFETELFEKAFQWYSLLILENCKNIRS